MRGNNAAPRTTNHALPSPREIPLLNDTVRMPWDGDGAPGERVVPPALAVLYRVAVGPAADYYVPRFLRFAGGGPALSGWHWPAMLAPAIWAFYRKLWLAAFGYGLLTLLGAAGFFAVESSLSDSTLAWIACGIGMVSTGVLLIGSGRSVTRSAIGWATATGVTIGAYTVIDAQGVRAAPSALSYIAWIFLMLGGVIGLAFALWRGPRFMLAARSEWRAGLFAGAMSIVTYGLALWAYRLGDTPRLAALRETSIVFATLIAIFILKERVTAARGAGIAVIALGAAVLLMSS